MESRVEKSWCAKLLPAITIMIAGRAPTTTLPARSRVAAFTAEDVSGGGIVVATSFTLPNIRHVHTLLVKSLGSHYVRDPLHPDRSVINFFHRFVNHHWGGQSPPQWFFLFSPPSESGFPLTIGSSVAFPGFAAEADRQMLGLLRLGLRDTYRQYAMLVERMGLVGIDGVREPQRSIEVAGAAPKPRHSRFMVSCICCSSPKGSQRCSTIFIYPLSLLALRVRSAGPPALNRQGKL